MKKPVDLKQQFSDEVPPRFTLTEKEIWIERIATAFAFLMVTGIFLKVMFF